jgi:hypothetical protein
MNFPPPMTTVDEGSRFEDGLLGVFVQIYCEVYSHSRTQVSLVTTFKGICVKLAMDEHGAISQNNNDKVER